MRKVIVAVVGRPNVGKSTLFNTIAGKQISIVQDTPGVTRDRIYAEGNWLNYYFTMVDTGGIEPISDDEVKHGLAFGLSSIVNHQLVHKKAHSVFKYIDDASATEGTADFARAIIGIDSWDQLIPNFRFPGR